MAEFKVGAQLIIWGERAESDLAGVLDEVASIGYAGIEAHPRHFEGVSDLKKTLNSRGLSLIGLHIGVAASTVQDIDEALGILKAVDGRYLLFSGAGGKENSDENYLRSSKLLEEYGARARKQGVKVCYHNHWQEVVDDARGTRIICQNTSPENVALCVDTYWVQCGGMSPVGFIERYRDRVAYMHFKDGTEEGLKKHEFTELGQGIVDFPAVMKAIKPLKIEWIVVEQDRTNKTPKESMTTSRKYLKQKLKL